MALKKEDMDSLLAKYVTGETNAEESAAVQNWIDGSEENRRDVERFRSVWQESQELGFEGTADVGAAWEEFRKRVRMVRPVYRRIRWVAAAAVVILIAGIGVLIRQSGASNHGPVMVQVFSGPVARTTTLPDGSVVRLDANAGLSYAPAFAGQQRKVVLTGGGFFEVARDARKPFLVAVDGITVTVLGTSFWIRSDARATEITVETGIVEVAGPRRSMKVYVHERLSVAQPDSGWIKEGAGFGQAFDTAVADTARPAKDTLTPEQAKKMERVSQAKKYTLAHRDSLAANKTYLDDDYHKRLTIMRAIIDDLIQRGFAKDRSGLKGVVLSETELVVNGVRQPDDLQKEFSKKYLDASGNGYFYGTISVTGKGWFFNGQDFK
jgi:transmembrane sensor